MKIFHIFVTMKSKDGIIVYNDYSYGLKLTGFPTSVRKFYYILAKESCHPKATHRILSRIHKNGFDLLTITNQVKILWVKEQLATIGVTLEFIKPDEDWVHKYEDNRYPEWAKLENVNKEIEKWKREH